MNKAKHTPGPWKICEYSWSDTGIYPNGENSWPVCKLNIYQATEETQSKLESIMDANARLIATAPELLEMCKSCAEDLAFSKENCDKELRQQLLSVIAKAEGD